MQRRMIRQFRKQWSESYSFRTRTSSTLALCITTVFALYHGLLGGFSASVWHKSICIFYLTLSAIRGIILLAEHRACAKQGEKKELLRRKVFLATAAPLFLLNLSLILPISLMALLQKPIRMGKVPAIAMATYTTYKITMAILHMHKRRGRSVLIRELRAINLIDALVSILTLQNTLIMVNTEAGEQDRMFTLSAISSAAIYLLIVIITLRLFLGERAGRTGSHLR